MKSKIIDNELLCWKNNLATTRESKLYKSYDNLDDEYIWLDIREEILNKTEYLINYEFLYKNEK